MTTSDLIDMITDYIGSELTPARALVYLNQAQNQLLIGENRLMRVTPDPFLSTVAGTYNYVASTEIYDSTGGVKGSTQYDIYNVSRIYTFNENQNLFAYNGSNVISQRREEAVNARASQEVNAKVDVIKSIEPSSQDCLIKWWEQNTPSNTTIDWRCECYRYPNQLTTINIALETPSQYHDTLLLWLVLKRLGIRQYGTSSIDQLIMPEMRIFKNQISKGANSFKSETPPIEV